MKVAVHFSVVIFAVLFASSVDTSFAQNTAGPAQFGDCTATQYANCDTSPDQAQLELPGVGGAQDGNWDDLAGGTTNRPYVQRLAVINGGVETILLENGTTASTHSNTPGSVGIIISPTNLCDSTENLGNNLCYSTPNRIQVTLVYRKSAGQVGTNLSTPNDVNYSGTTGTQIPLLSFDGSQPVTIDANTTIDLTLALNTLGTSLRWTWLNGIPSFWGLDALGEATATLRLKFNPAMQPVLHYPTLPNSASACTAIPVLACELTRSNSDWLGATMVLSLDDTLGQGMTGALFGTEGAIIGSVEASTDAATGLPRLTYGVASSHEDYTGTIRSATLRAFIPAAAVVQVLGIPSFNDNTAGSISPSDIISVQRVDASSSSTSSFEVWDEATNGEDGLLVTVSGITFSAPQYRVNSKKGVPKVPSVKLTKGKYTFTLQGSTTGALKTCKTKSCKVTVYRASSNVYQSTINKVALAPAKISGSKLSASFALKKSAQVKSGTDLLVVVTNSSKKVLSSTPIELRN